MFYDLVEARRWATAFVDWYNIQHRHSGIAWHTPVSVFQSTWIDIDRARQRTLDTAWATSPARFVTRPIAPRPPIEVWINDPAKRFQTA